MSDNILATMIFSSYDESVDVGMLGEKLLDEANSKIKPKTDEDEFKDISEKLIELRIEEDKENLVWIDYNSWNFLSKDFKDFITNHIDPLFWTGVFFKYSDFIKYEEHLCSLIEHNGFLSLLKEMKKNYMLVWMSNEDSSYCLLNDQRLRYRQRDYFDKVIKTYGKDSYGNVVIKTYTSGG